MTATSFFAPGQRVSLLARPGWTASPGESQERADGGAREVVSAAARRGARAGRGDRHRYPPLRPAIVARAACYTPGREGSRVPVYSHSRLSAYEKCPLQYRFRYIDKIKRDVQGSRPSWATASTRCWSALPDLLMSKRPSLDELVTLYHGTGRRLLGQGDDRQDRVHPDHYRQVGERCVAGYYRRYEPFDQATTLGLEEGCS